MKPSKSWWLILKIKIFSSKKEIDFFTLEELESQKEGVLILESNLFHLIQIEISKEIDDREREFEIEEKLEEIFQEYDSFNFLSKELLLKESENNETILLIMIEKEKIYNLLDRVKEMQIKLFGIYPLFLMEFFNLNGIEKTYLEYFDENIYIYNFSENKLINFEKLEIETQELIDNPDYLTEYIRGEIFTYSNQLNITEVIPNIIVRRWQEYSLFLNKEFNFLPEDYLYSEKFKTLYKALQLGLSVWIIFLTLSFFFINFLTQRKDEELISIQNQLATFHESNKEKKLKISEIEDKISKLREESLKREVDKLQLSELIQPLLENPFRVMISSLSLDENKILTMKGEVGKKELLYKFENYLLSFKKIKNINHDIITTTESGGYNFIMDMEVEDELD